MQPNHPIATTEATGKQDAGLQSQAHASELLIKIANELQLELHARRSVGRRIGLGGSLERDWGFDSLSRAELLLRIERAFSVSRHKGGHDDYGY